MLKQQEEQQRNSLEQALKLHRKTSLPLPLHAPGMKYPAQQILFSVCDDATCTAPASGKCMMPVTWHFHC